MLAARGFALPAGEEVVSNGSMQAVNGVAIVAATPYTSKVVLIKVNGTTFAAFYAFLSFLYTDNVCFEDHLALAEWSWLRGTKLNGCTSTAGVGA